MKIFVFIISSFLLAAQGFDWQKSTRLPYVIPQLYIGGIVKVGSITNSGNFSVDRDGEFCCEYENGEGNNFELGLMGNYWLWPKLKIMSAISYQNWSSDFSKDLLIPQSDGTQLELNYKTALVSNLLGFKIGAEYRVFKKLNLGLLLGTNINVSNQVSTIVNTQKSGVSGKVDLNNMSLDNQRILIDYSFRISYDIGLNAPNYISPFVSYNRNFNSFSQSGSLYYNSINIGIIFQRGIRI